METVLITGASGLIGKHLQTRLQEKGYRTITLSRTKLPKTDSTVFYWDIDKMEIDCAAIEQADHIIHLAGENIGNKRWTNRQKQIIISSRTKSTELLLSALIKNTTKPQSFISASAVGIYGSVTSEHIFTETHIAGNDFLGQTCAAWEQSANKISEIGIRTVKLRTGVVLTKNGGALSKIIKPIKLRLALPLGNGHQYIPWIHINDLCNMYIKAMEDTTMTGAYNAVAPEHITQKQFAKTVAHLLHKPFFNIRIPACFIKLALGKMATIVLEGSKISAQKIEDAGFKFKFRNLNYALEDLIKR